MNLRPHLLPVGSLIWHASLAAALAAAGTLSVAATLYATKSLAVEPAKGQPEVVLYFTGSLRQAQANQPLSSTLAMDPVGAPVDRVVVTLTKSSGMGPLSLVPSPACTSATIRSSERGSELSCNLEVRSGALGTVQLATVTYQAPASGTGIITIDPEKSATSQAGTNRLRTAGSLYTVVKP